MNTPTLLLTYTASGNATSWTTGAATAPTSGKYVWVVVSIGRGAGATDIASISGMGASSFVRVADTGSGGVWRTITYRAVGANATTAITATVTSGTHTEARIQAFETDPAVVIQSRFASATSTSPAIDMVPFGGADNQVWATLQLQAAPTVTPEAGLTTLQTTGTTQTLSTIYGDGTEDSNLSVTLGSSTLWRMTAFELAPTTQSPTRVLLSYALTNASGQTSFTTHAGELPSSGKDVFAVVAVGRATGAQALTGISGYGATWTEIADNTPTNTDDYRVKVYRLTGTLDGSAVTFTVSATHTEGICQIFETDPVDFVQAAYNDATSGTTPSVTMAAFDSVDSLVVLVTTKTTGAPPVLDTPEAGLSLLVQSGKQQIAIGDGTEDTTLTSTIATSGEWLATGLEFSLVPPPPGEPFSAIDPRVEIAFGDDPLTASPTWVDVSDYCTGFSVRRGRSSLLEDFEAGHGVIRLENIDGRFDPNNTSGAYSPGVTLRVPVRISIDHNNVDYIVFRGLVEAWPIQYGSGGYTSWCDVPIVDLTKLLAGYQLEAFTLSQANTVGERIEAILDEVGWPAGQRDIADGLATRPNLTFSGSAIDLIRDEARADSGFFFIGADGTAIYRGRTTYAGGNLINGTFGQADDEIGYERLTVAYDDDRLFNIAVVSQSGNYDEIDSAIAAGSRIVAPTDTTSIANFGPYQTEIVSAFWNVPEARSAGRWAISRYADQRVRIRSMTLFPQFDEDNTYPQVLGRELRDGLVVKFQPPGGGTPLNQEVAVEAISHDVTATTWVTEWELEPLAAIETGNFFTLGTSGSSLLGGTDVLA